MNILSQIVHGSKEVPDLGPVDTEVRTPASLARLMVYYLSPPGADTRGLAARTAAGNIRSRLILGGGGGAGLRGRGGGHQGGVRGGHHPVPHILQVVRGVWYLA